MMNKNRSKSALYSLDDLWKIERQLDAINQHTRIALSQVRKAIKDRETTQGIKAIIEPSLNESEKKGEP